VLSYARDYRLIEFVCKHFDWICRQVFLVETKQALDTGSDQGRDGEHPLRELDKLLIVNELITSGLGVEAR
jgi:hypothetical protein